MVYKVTIALSKISIVFLYLRIFVGNLFRRICWLFIVVVICYTIGSSTATVFQCTPIRRAWDRAVFGTCINLTVSWYANAAFSIFSDLAILTLPMPVIKSLKLPKRARIGLMSIFAVGVLYSTQSFALIQTDQDVEPMANAFFDLFKCMYHERTQVHDIKCCNKEFRYNLCV